MHGAGGHDQGVLHPVGDNEEDGDHAALHGSVPRVGDVEGAHADAELIRFVVGAQGDLHPLTRHRGIDLVRFHESGDGDGGHGEIELRSLRQPDHAHVLHGIGAVRRRAGDDGAVAGGVQMTALPDGAHLLDAADLFLPIQGPEGPGLGQVVLLLLDPQLRQADGIPPHAGRAHIRQGQLCQLDLDLLLPLQDGLVLVGIGQTVFHALQGGAVAAHIQACQLLARLHAAAHADVHPRHGPGNGEAQLPDGGQHQPLIGRDRLDGAPADRRGIQVDALGLQQLRGFRSLLFRAAGQGQQEHRRRQQAKQGLPGAFN